VRAASLTDIRYALRGIRRAPLFAASVSATIGLGLGVLCSAFAIANAYLLRPVDLPEPWSLYELAWDTATTRRQGFALADVEALRATAPHYSGLAASRGVLAMRDDQSMVGRLVDGTFFQLLGTQPAMGRLLTPADAEAGEAVVVLSHSAWQSRFGADPRIIGTQIRLGRQQFDVVGVTSPRFNLPGAEFVAFWAPLAMAPAFGAADARSSPDDRTLAVMARLREEADVTQARAWLDLWLRQRFPEPSELTPVNVRVESRATRIPLTGTTLTMFTLLIAAFGIVLLVACANVTNLLIARGFGRQREFGVRLALGAGRGRIVRQLIVEGLVLAVPAAVVGLVLTMVTARVFPWLIVATIPSLLASSIADFLAPMAPDFLVIMVLVTAAVGSAVLVSVAPAMRLARLDLVRASKGEVAGDAQRSRLRAGLVALQIGACALFLVVAGGLILESRQMANPDTGFSYEQVADVRIAPSLRGTLAERLALDPEVEHVAAAWEPPLSGPLPQVGVVASRTGIVRTAGFMVVSPGYFALFDVQILRGRAFTPREAADGEPLALVSAATARAIWPGLDPIGQTLDLRPALAPGRRPEHTHVRVIGVTEDVANGMLGGGFDPTCIYFATGFAPAGGLSVLVRGRTTTAALRAAVGTAAAAIDPAAPFQFFALRDMVGGQAWVFSAFSAGASFLGLLGLLLACSGTFAVVSFLVTQRKREFGIRMALGATVRQIVSSILHDTLRTASIGLALGLAAALALVTALAAAVEIIHPFGPTPFLAAAAIVLGATTAAAAWPSLRAARIDPARALRVD